jgi:hypothetical protein
MNLHVKTSIILIVTLLIGMVLGALLGGAFLRSRVKHRVERMRTPQGLAERMEKIIQPDDTNREAVREVLRKHAARFSEYHEGFAALADSLHKDLDPILTDEQKQRMEWLMEPLHRRPPRMHRPGMGRPGRRPHEKPPPPGGQSGPT